jgi:hypothetical protein
MGDEQRIKVVGRRRQYSPEENLRRAHALQEFAERFACFARPRGFVFYARAREDYERWRQVHSNPRLW